MFFFCHGGLDSWAPHPTFSKGSQPTPLSIQPVPPSGPPPGGMGRRPVPPNMKTITSNAQEGSGSGAGGSGDAGSGGAGGGGGGGMICL